jgi:outer membrane protein assembly factor BamB
MERLSRVVALLAPIVFGACGDNAPMPADPHCADWHQWGGNPAHTGESCATGQPLQRILADVVIDTLVPEEVGGVGGDLVVHYQTPLIDGDRVFMVQKAGTYTGCVPDMDPTMFCQHPEDFHRFESQTWSELGYAWQGDALVETWRFDSDWKPPLGQEVVFQPVISGSRVAIPESSGGVAFVDAATGKVLHSARPFGHDPTVFISGALTDFHGVIYYNAVKMDPDQPYNLPMQAWLVEIDGDGRVRKADYSDLVPGPVSCYGTYDVPPGTPVPVVDDGGHLQLPKTGPCGPQLPGFNQAPAVAFDGTVYVATHAQYQDRYSYVVSINPGAFDLNWATSLRDVLDDGCGVLVQCGPGAPMGVEPFTGMKPTGEVTDQSTSSPVVLPDGRVLYAAWSFYNADRGHLFELSRGGKVLGTYDFGWDLTPAVSTVGGVTRIALKDNHYGEYMGVDQGPYYLTMLDDALEPMWNYQSTNTKSCARQPDGSETCTDDHPHGFEWCINAPAIDAAGTMYANSEDGNLYAIGPDGQLRANLLLGTALGAAYTPVALDHVGRIYALNAGHLYVVGAN